MNANRSQRSGSLWGIEKNRTGRCCVLWCEIFVVRTVLITVPWAVFFFLLWPSNSHSVVPSLSHLERLFCSGPGCQKNNDKLRQTSKTEKTSRASKQKQQHTGTGTTTYTSNSSFKSQNNNIDINPKSTTMKISALICTIGASAIAPSNAFLSLSKFKGVFVFLCNSFLFISF